MRNSISSQDLQLLGNLLGSHGLTAPADDALVALGQLRQELESCRGFVARTHFESLPASVQARLWREMGAKLDRLNATANAALKGARWA